MLDIVLLISGTGSNSRALIESLEHSDVDARVVAIGADRQCAGLELGVEHGIPTFVVPFASSPSREAWSIALRDRVLEHRPQLVILSGLMRLVSPVFVEAFAPQLLNTHPAYLPEFPGAHAVRDALAAGVTETGASVIVVGTGVDDGPIIARRRVPVLAGDDEAALHDRIKPVERELLFDIVRRIASGELDLAAAGSGQDASASPEASNRPSRGDADPDHSRHPDEPDEGAHAA